MNTCFECGQPAEHNHHVIPKCKGGTKTVPLCTKCHGLVHDKDMVRWSTLCRLGQIRAWENGVRWGGSPKGWHWKITGEQIAKIKDMKAAGEKITHIARSTGLSRPTIYRVLRSETHIGKGKPRPHFSPKPQPPLPLRTQQVLYGQAVARRKGKKWGGSKKGWRWKVTKDQVTAIKEMKVAGKKISHHE